jgi:hypothetical protein
MAVYPLDPLHYQAFSRLSNILTPDDTLVSGEVVQIKGANDMVDYPIGWGAGLQSKTVQAQAKSTVGAGVDSSSAVSSSRLRRQLPDARLPVVQYQQCMHNGRLVVQPVRLLLPKREAEQMDIGVPLSSGGGGGGDGGGAEGEVDGVGGQAVGREPSSPWVSVLFQWCKQGQLKHPCCDDVNSCYRVVVAAEEGEGEDEGEGAGAGLGSLGGKGKGAAKGGISHTASGGNTNAGIGASVGGSTCSRLRVQEIRRPASHGGEDLLGILANQEGAELEEMAHLMNSNNVVPVTYTVKSAAGGFYLYM